MAPLNIFEGKMDISKLQDKDFDEIFAQIMKLMRILYRSGKIDKSIYKDIKRAQRNLKKK